MKKGIDFFNMLTEEEQNEFEKAFKRDLKYYLNDLYFNFSNFIRGSFAWSETEQVFDYWNNLTRKYDN